MIAKKKSKKNKDSQPSTPPKQEGEPNAMPPATLAPANALSFNAIERTYELARWRLNEIGNLPPNIPGKQALYDDAWEEAELARATWIDAMAKVFSPNDHRVGELTTQLRNKIDRINQLLNNAQAQAETFALISSAIGLATQLVRIAGIL